MSNCELCGEPMPEGETMFKYHGYSGNCPKPPLPRPAKPSYEELEQQITTLSAELAAEKARAEAVTKLALKDPVIRLHNLFAALEEQKADSPYSAEAWDELVADNEALRKRATAAELALAESGRDADSWVTKEAFDALKNAGVGIPLRIARKFDSLIENAANKLANGEIALNGAALSQSALTRED